MLFATLLLAPAAFAMPVPAGSALGPGAARVALFHGTASGAGDVVLVDPAGVLAHVRPVALQAITLLPIEFNGRSELERLLPGRARRHVDVPGASRIELPGDTGSLYHFVRDDAGLLRFGYFIVDASGDARSLVERDGAGAQGDENPFVERIAVAPDGLAFLLATRKPAGGDLFEVALDGTVVERTSTLGAQAFQAGGLSLLDGWGIASTPRGVWRFDRTAGAQAGAVPFDPLPPWFSGDVVTSRDGAHAATIAGAAASSAHTFVFTSAGPAMRASQTAMPLSGAGFLPDALDGPHLAVSDDGTTCAWRVEAATSREAFVARMGAVQTTQSWITADANYVDTLDEVGQFIFMPLSNTLILAIGAVGDVPSSIEDVDYYAVSLAGDGTPSLANLTGTSGDFTAPFAGGSTLEPVGAALVPGSDRLLLFDDHGTNGPLVLVEPSGSTTLLNAVRELEFVERVHGDLVIGVKRLVGGMDVIQVHVLQAGASSTQHVGLPGPAGDLTNALAGPAGRVAFLLRVPMAEFVWVCDPAALTLQTLTVRPLAYGPTLAFTSTGLLALTVGGPFGPTVKIGWDAPGAIIRLPVGSGPGFVLPGA